MSATHVYLGSQPLTEVDEFGCTWSTDPAQWDGWAGATAPRLDPQPRSRQDGLWLGQGYADGRHVRAGGLLAAPDQDSLLAAIDRLNSAAVTQVNLRVVEGTYDRSAAVQFEDVVLITFITDVLATWSVQLLAADPRRFSATITGSTHLRQSAGGLTVPFTIPFTINATVVSGQVALNNTGTKPGTVTMRVDGPCHGPIITHRGTGATLTFAASLVLSVGEWLDIDMDAHTVLANGQASRRGYVTSAGWSTFEPGLNIWLFTAALFDAGATLTVNGTPAA